MWLSEHFTKPKMIFPLALHFTIQWCVINVIEATNENTHHNITKDSTQINKFVNSKIECALYCKSSQNDFFAYLTVTQECICSQKEIWHNPHGEATVNGRRKMNEKANTNVWKLYNCPEGFYGRDCHQFLGKLFSFRKSKSLF